MVSSMILAKRMCVDCKSHDTVFSKTMRYFVWHKKNGGYQCQKCKSNDKWIRIKSDPKRLKKYHDTAKKYRDKPKNKLKKTKYNVISYAKNKEKILIRMKKHNQRPDIILKTHKRRHKWCSDAGSLFNLSSHEYRYTLVSWSKVIKINNICQVCGSKDNLEAHHIFHKIKYPKLSLNPNNGIALCRQCHKETHII